MIRLELDDRSPLARAIKAEIIVRLRKGEKASGRNARASGRAIVEDAAKRVLLGRRGRAAGLLPRGEGKKR